MKMMQCLVKDIWDLVLALLAIKIFWIFRECLQIIMYGKNYLLEIPMKDLLVMVKGFQKYYHIWGLLTQSINLVKILIIMYLLMTRISTTTIPNIISIKKMIKIKLKTHFKFPVWCLNTITEEVVQLCQTVH